MRPLMQRMLLVALTTTWRREEIVERAARRVAVWERERHDREAAGMAGHTMTQPRDMAAPAVGREARAMGA
jgi:hypothetical protein